MKSKKKKILKILMIYGTTFLAVPIIILLCRPELISLMSRPKKKQIPKIHSVHKKENNQIPYNGHAIAQMGAIFPLEHFQMAEDEMKFNRQFEMLEAQEENEGRIVKLPYDDSWLPDQIKPIFDLNKTRKFRKKLSHVHSLSKNSELLIWRK